MNNINKLEVTGGMDDDKQLTRKLTTSQVSTPWPPMLNAQVEKSSGAISKRRSNQQQPHKADDKESADKPCEMQTDNFSITQLPVTDLENAPIRETGKKVEKKYQTPSELPPQSFPSSEEEAIKDAAKGNVSQYYSAVDLHAAAETNKMPLQVQLSSSEYHLRPPSLAPEMKNEPGQCQNAVPEICKADHSSDQLVDGQQSKYTPSRPASPEAAHSLQNPTTIVTGLPDSVGHLFRSGQNSTMALVCQPKGKSEALNNQESGSPTEHDDHFAVLIQKAKCAALEAECERKAREFLMLEAESQEMIKKIREMYISKEQECKKLAELVRQKNQQYDSANVHMETLKREKNKISEELNSVTGQVQELKSQKQKLQEELEQLRLDFEKRTAVVYTECCNAVQKAKNMNMKLAKETSKAKRMKRQLARERSKRTRMELKLESERRKGKRMGKKNKKVCKELRMKTAELGNSLAKQQDLEECREQILAQLRRAQATSEEDRRRFEENVELLAESDELCRKSYEMYLWKEQECKRMEGLLQEQQQQYDAVIRDMEKFQRESQEDIDSLRRNVLLSGKMYLWKKEECKKMDASIQQQYQKYDDAIREMEALQKEMKKLRLENEQKLQDERRLAEVPQVFHNSERMKVMKLNLPREANKVKKLKMQLAREIRNRRRMELKLANDKRKGKRMEKRNRKSYIWKCPRKEEKGRGRRRREGGWGGDDDDDDEDDDDGEDDDGVGGDGDDYDADDDDDNDGVGSGNDYDGDGGDDDDDEDDIDDTDDDGDDDDGVGDDANGGDNDDDDDDDDDGVHHYDGDNEDNDDDGVDDDDDDDDDDEDEDEDGVDPFQPVARMEVLSHVMTAIEVVPL